MTATVIDIKRAYQANPEHPAKYSEGVLAVMRDLLHDEARARRDRTIRVLDPFAGVGRIHQLARADWLTVETVGVEIEPEWAACNMATEVGDATALRWPEKTFHVVATSPCYGNRMADHHEAKDGSVRKGYRFALGRMPSEGSAAVLQWGPEYRYLHQQAMDEMRRVLRRRGLLIVNVSNHVRRKELVDVVGWWREALLVRGLRPAGEYTVETRRMRLGQNRDARADAEHVLTFRRP